MLLHLESPRLALLILLAAMALDFVAGEFPNALHPVVWIGTLIKLLEKLSPRDGKFRQFVAGCLIAVLVPGLAVSGGLLLQRALQPRPLAYVFVSALLLKAMFALRALGKAAFGVANALKSEQIPVAREGLRSLCSRDPSALEQTELVAATIESVAENSSDSFVAPIFYYVLFGLPGALGYRAVNTLDAMIGYHGRYEYLGKASARLDDVLNFIPARITALLILLAGALARKDISNGWQVLRRDGPRTESPNAGRPMAAMAGLLRIQLEKAGHYQLGLPLEALAVEKINEAWRVVTIAAFIGLSAYSILLGLR